MLLSEVTASTLVPIAQLSKQLVGTMSWEKAFELVADDMEPRIENLKFTMTPVSAGQMQDMPFYISGYYDDEEGEVINVDVAFERGGSVTWNNANRKKFLRDIQDTIRHELVHKGQHSKRPDYMSGPDDGRDKRNMRTDYLSRPEEIEAFALNIADQLVRAKRSKKGALDLLRTVRNTSQMRDKVGNLLSPELSGYMQDIGDNREVMNRLYKKIFQYINER